MPRRPTYGQVLHWCVAVAFLGLSMYGSLMFALAFPWVAAPYPGDVKAAVLLLASAALGVIGVAGFRLFLERRVFSLWLSVGLFFPAVTLLLFAIVDNEV